MAKGKEHLFIIIAGLIVGAASVLLETAVLFGVLLWRQRRGGHD